MDNLENEKVVENTINVGSSKDEHVIVVDHLTKDFGGGMGIFDVNFYVNKGEVYGFLGPNGAGKSTTIRHLMGYYKPESGKTYINGHESFTEYHQLLKDVGYLPGEPALPLYFTGWQFIEEMKALKNVTDDIMLKYLIDYFQVDPNLPCKEMSMGMKRKMAIVVAFMSNPDVLILDEPTSGLDPTMQEKFIEFVRDEKKRGKTILLSSHIFSEVDATCDRISIIKDGKIVTEFIADTLKHATTKKYMITFSYLSELKDFISKVIDDKVKLLDEDDEKLKLVISTDDEYINEFIVAIGSYKVLDFIQIKETLQDFFMSFYKEDKEFSGVK